MRREQVVFVLEVRTWGGCRWCCVMCAAWMYDIILCVSWSVKAVARSRVWACRDVRRGGSDAAAVMQMVAGQCGLSIEGA
jgi:hypothetical protein